MVKRWVFAAPFLAGAILLVALPAGAAVYLAFTEYFGFGAATFTGTANFERLLGDETFWLSLGNAAIVAALVVPLHLVLAVGCALLLHRRSWAGGFARTAVYLPAVVPDAAWALLWLWLLNPLYGPLPLALEGLGLPSPQWFTDPSAARVGLALIVGFQIGEAFVVALAARATVPPRLYEAAAVEGAGGWYTFRRVTLRLMAPILGLLAFRDLLLVLQTTFVPALLVTDGDPHNATLVSPLYIYRRAFRYGELGYASTASLALLLLTALVVVLQIVLVRRMRDRLSW